ncbi:vitamin D3 receptor A-like [Paramacrobiotus metropolitanus]|uniref:vitamin D3 receptor A-like n=1 Tax=Paramacrobiotus metropolitanus TaxID=2943436 RepID=UPI00244609FD|nr:vitamin D3 receptor A-like [Paramacrobiotus metropolitanus]
MVRKIEELADIIVANVCGAKATGNHYGAVTCEGCFFKRSLPVFRSFRCFFGHECEIALDSRNRCKACRFTRCIQAGMALDDTLDLIRLFLSGEARTHSKRHKKAYTDRSCGEERDKPSKDEASTTYRPTKVTHDSLHAIRDSRRAHLHRPVGI